MKMAHVASAVSPDICTTFGSVLVAEDNRTVGRVIGKILEKEGYRVAHVVEGHAALDALLNQRFDLALLDADLPGMNALEVTNLYRFGSVGRHHLPILGLIGEMTAQRLSAWIDAGLDGCISKPIEPTELLEAISSSLGGASNACVIGSPPPASREPRPSVEDIALGPAIDRRILCDLEKLGGQSFIEDVIHQFIADASHLLPDLSASVAAGDTHMFHDHIHALRSCAGNVGATGLYKMCLAWRALNAQELATNGVECVTRLEAEFARAAAALDRNEWREPQTLQRAG
jgi:two-component system sensor histidine kinase RpfC